MPTMSRVEAAFCRTSPWRLFTRRVVLSWALAGARPFGEVLEIGAGSGAMADALLAAYPDISITATDYDGAMVNAMQSRLGHHGSRAKATRADATALDYSDGTFDTVLTFIMLHHTIHWERALREAVRVLRPGGQLVGYDLLAARPLRLLHQIERAPHRLLTQDDLRDVLDDLPVCAVSIQPGLANHLVRLAAQRSEL
jgi:ubiquinone/menaquinone biosynthesis C-methylase UbiE